MNPTIYTNNDTYDEMEFIPGIKSWFNIQKSINDIYHVNELWKKNRMFISTDEISIPDKNLKQTRNRRELSQPDKGCL